MSTGAEHYRHAETLLAEADQLADNGYPFDANCVAVRAQAHATLALAAATALNDFRDGSPVEDLDAWREAAGEYETRQRRAANQTTETVTTPGATS